MHRNDIAGASKIGQLHRLFGSAMVPNPGIVRADGQDGSVEGAAGTDICKQRRARRVAAKQDRSPFAAENVTVVSAFPFARPAFTPMLDFKRFDFQVTLWTLV